VPSPIRDDGSAGPERHLVVFVRGAADVCRIEWLAYERAGVFDNLISGRRGQRYG
jgi:hypothetical protein